MFSNDLRKPRCLFVFVLLIVAYATVWFFILRSDIRVSNYFYIFASPFEGGAMAFILTVLGHGRGNGLGQAWPPNKTIPKIG